LGSKYRNIIICKVKIKHNIWLIAIIINIKSNINFRR